MSTHSYTDSEVKSVVYAMNERSWWNGFYVGSFAGLGVTLTSVSLGLAILASRYKN